MLTNDTNATQTRLTQDIDPKFIRTMKGDLTNPVGTSPDNSNSTQENPFIKEKSPTNQDIWQDLEIQKVSSDTKINTAQSNINSSFQNPLDNNRLTNNKLAEANQIQALQGFSNTLPENEIKDENVPVDKSQDAREESAFNINTFEDLQLPQKESILPDNPIKSIPHAPLVNSQEAGAIQQPKIQVPSKNSGEKVIVAAILTLIIISLGGGGYYYWATKRTTSEQNIGALISENSSDTSTQQQPQKTENPVTIDPISAKYSLEKPNLLTINTNTVSSLEIKGLFTTIGDEVKKINPPKPLEFILVDENNNPIAFSRFIALAKIELPKTLVSNFDEKFSLFYYIDNGFVKTGLLIDSKSKIATISEMKNAEKNIIQALDILYLENKYAPQNPTFNNGTYKSFQIKYFNIDQKTQTSFDYTITDNYLIIGTSKDTLRSIIENRQL